MSKSKTGKKIMNMVYGLGGAIVIIGALFKIMHWPFGNEMLIVGLLTEAVIFIISAFEAPEEDLDWSLVYPELSTGELNASKKNDKNAIEEPKDAEGILSKKLDEMLKGANIDSELMTSLGNSIRSFEGAAKGIAPTAEAMSSTKKYSEEMSLAATQMESLNSLYKVQVESSSRQAEINEQVTANAGKLKEQMESLATNLSSLNGVYGGMLSAMSK